MFWAAHLARKGCEALGDEPAGQHGERSFIVLTTVYLWHTIIKLDVIATSSPETLHPLIEGTRWPKDMNVYFIVPLAEPQSMLY